MAAAPAEEAKKPRFIDIGINLTDPMFRGVYRGKQYHKDDFDAILQRSKDAGVERLLITGSCLSDSRECLKLAQLDDCMYFTVGCHPTRCTEFVEDPDKYFTDLLGVITEGGKKVIAVGECGLDYDRLQFCPRETQLVYFERQFDLAEQTGLPMFLHDRASHEDFTAIMKKHRHRIRGGVVHSFDGPLDVALEYIAMGLYIGINGCSLKHEQNLEVVRNLPLQWMMIETDAPWCEIRPTHDGFKFVKTVVSAKKHEKFEDGCYVKGRNEPALIRQVLEVIAGVRGEPLLNVAETLYNNTLRLFFPDEAPPKSESQ